MSIAEQARRFRARRAWDQILSVQKTDVWDEDLKERFCRKFWTIYAEALAGLPEITEGL